MRTAFRGFGFALIMWGVLLFLDVPSLTGFTIVEDIGVSARSILGIVFILGGVLLISPSRKESNSELEESVKEAVSRGVPLEEAKKIRDYLNGKVESGEWIELGVENVATTKHNTAKDKEEGHPFYQGTSLCRYWGPKQYADSTRSRLHALYRKGVIGKTHEIRIGSDRYPRTGVGNESEGSLSRPGPGSRAVHRHWEIEQMYRYRKEKDT